MIDLGANFNLEGKVAVITGGSGVLGSEMAETLALKGVKVCILATNEEKIANVVDKINKNDGKAVGIKTDVLNKSLLEEAREEVLSHFGGVDILINCAGGNKAEATTSAEQSFFDIPEEAIQWVFNLNFMGAVLTSQVFGKVMVEKGSGSIINISSMAAITPLTKTIAYSAAKAALSNFTRWLAVYINQNYSKEIRVNALAPGFILTDQNRYLLIDRETGSETERGKKIKDNTPMERYGSPEELTGTLIWLCSEASSFVNGIIVPIDGGFSAYSGV